MTNVRDVNVVKMAQVADSTILSGALRGQEILAKLLTAASDEPAYPQPIFLDFSQIAVATASFLRESVLTFRQIVRNRRSNLYPVIANANADVCEELAQLAQFRSETILSCNLNADREVTQLRLIGGLDPKQKLTFEAVHQRGETDAGELMRNFKTEKVGPTAWNNRLAALVDLGLIVEVNQGRSKRYKPLFTGVHRWA